MQNPARGKGIWPAGLSVGDEDLGDLGGPSAGQVDAGRVRDSIGRHWALVEKAEEAGVADQRRPGQV
jgi:hypothetical protein